MTAAALPGPWTRQCYVLRSWVEEHDWAVGCEVGVLRGRNLFSLLDWFPELSMIAVDQWLCLEDTGEPGFETYVLHDMERYAAFVMKTSLDYGARCRVIRQDSVAAAGLILDVTLDFVFIDACHTEAAVRADIMAWAPKIKSTGYLCGHDRHRPEVRLVLDELLPGWEPWPSECWRIPRNAIRGLNHS